MSIQEQVSTRILSAAQTVQDTVIDTLVSIEIKTNEHRKHKTSR
jgi:hypothetical protein